MPLFTALIALGGVGIVMASIDFQAKTIGLAVFVGAAMILIGIVLWFVLRRSRR